MISSLRKKYNQEFTQAKYEAYVAELSNLYPGQLEFRLAETPVFVPAAFRNGMEDACEKILDVVLSPDYMLQS